MKARKKNKNQQENMLRARAKGVAMGLRPVKVSMAEQRWRMSMVEELMLRFRTKAEVVRLCMKGFKPKDERFFRLGRSTVARYMSLVEKRWETEAEPQRLHLKEWTTRSIISDLAAMRAQGKWNGVASMRRLLAQVDGVLAPIKHEVAIRETVHTQAVSEGWTDAEKKTFLETGEWPDRAKPRAAIAAVVASSANGTGTAKH